jgi:hypothetical protein
MLHKLGAVFYVIWGLLHLNAARGLYQLGTTLDTGIVQARIYQGAWHLLFFAIAAVAIAVFCNWKNSRLGYWLNLSVVTVVDVGFIWLVLLPYLEVLSPAGLGPLFWILAVIFSTLGYLKENRTP